MEIDGEEDEEDVEEDGPLRDDVRFFSVLGDNVLHP